MPMRSDTARVTFSSTVKPRNSAVIWKVRAMPRLTRCACDSEVMSAPSSRMRPSLGASTPVTKLMKLVLPAPLGPISACRAPRARLKSIVLATLSAPKLLHSALVSSAGVACDASLTACSSAP